VACSVTGTRANRRVVHTGHGEAHSILQTDNPGEVLPLNDIDELFEPFRRGNGRNSSQGVGLGLSIVRSVAQPHGGKPRRTHARAAALSAWNCPPARNLNLRGGNGGGAQSVIGNLCDVHDGVRASSLALHCSRRGAGGGRRRRRTAGVVGS
jgi:Histidine kinase-, DNA gyrase B-, and HSP90-like ATPase